MTMITVGSVVGSPGATTVALAMARQRRRSVTLVEADADGGRLASWLQIDHRPGLVDLLASVRHVDPEELFALVQRRDPQSDIGIITAHPSGEIVERALRSGVDDLVHVVGRVTEDMVVDVGRYRAHGPCEPLIRAAACRVVVTRGELGDVVVLSQALSRLRQHGHVQVVLCGVARYGAAEISSALEVAVLEMPPLGASLPSRRFLRSVDELNHRVWAEDLR